MTSQAPTQGPTDAGLTARVLSSEWQPIETAPKDGAWVLVYWPTMPITIYPKTAFNCGDEYGWDTPDDYGQVYPTHWMPLPAPPTNKGAA